MFIPRPTYLSQLIAGQQNGLIKIITGLRRCGKSFLLFRIFADHLLQSGVSADHIIKIDFEDIRNRDLKDPLSLVNYIDSKLIDDRQYYILMDEIQNITDFAYVLNSYLKIDNVDIYVTGSNSRFLSSDIATEFRGRGDEIKMYPLSFSEYYSVFSGDKTDAWRNYFTYGGLPHILQLETHSKKATYLKNLYETVYRKDLEERERISKIKEFDELVRTIASAIGSPCNPTKLSNTFKTEEKSDISPQTIRNYLGYLENAYIIEKAERYDVKGKKYINTLSKYYMTDTGIRNAILDFRQQEETHLMENIIYNELCIRGFTVDVGIVVTKGRNENNEWYRRQFEVDFVANLGYTRYYIQSALSIPDKTKLIQESNSLRNIDDDFKKIIIVKDHINPWYTDEGILVIGLFDFLLSPDSLSM